MVNLGSGFGETAIFRSSWTNSHSLPQLEFLFLPLPCWRKNFALCTTAKIWDQDKEKHPLRDSASHVGFQGDCGRAQTVWPNRNFSFTSLESRSLKLNCWRGCVFPRALVRTFAMPSLLPVCASKRFTPIPASCLPHLSPTYARMPVCMCVHVCTCVHAQAWVFMQFSPWFLGLSFHPFTRTRVTGLKSSF